jgi:exosortase
MTVVPSAEVTATPMSWRDALSRLGEWIQRAPVQALLVAAILGVLIYFFGFYKVFMNGNESTAVWAWRAWNEENDLEHGWLILPAAMFIVWYHRDALRAAPKEPSALGLLFVFAGVVLFVLSVRTLQGRLALVAPPLLIYGVVRFLWGKAAARYLIFPCAFMLFMVPAGFLVSRTVGLQTLAATVAAKLSAIVGIAVQSDGATLRALDGSFQFEIAGGCSGIRSLTAMTMLAALYVHFTQRELWKKTLIFGSSLVFALIGNLVRIFTVVIFARFINPDLAAGLYHDYSGFIFFPIAVGAMVGFSNLLNRDWNKLVQAGLARDEPIVTALDEAGDPARAQEKRTGPISYDY